MSSHALSTIRCNNDASTIFKNSKAKVYKSISQASRVCTADDLLEQGTSIQGMRNVMSSNHDTLKDLTPPQRALLAFIEEKYNIKNPGHLATYRQECVASVMFDMKAMGDITQFEYFIENLETFTSFETHDTILLLLAIICVGEKYASLSTTHGDKLLDSCYLRFATDIEKLPGHYKFSIKELNDIYNTMCNTVFATTGGDSEDQRYALKIFGRIVDACHDFLIEKKKKQRVAELLTIEKYLIKIL